MMRIRNCFAFAPLLVVALAAQPRAEDLAAAMQRSREASARHDYPGMLQATREILPIAEQLGDTLQVAKCYRSLGAIQFQLQDVTAALDSYRKAVDISSSNGHKSVEAESWRGVSLTSNWLGQTQESFAAAETSLKLYRELGNSVDVAGALMIVGNLYAQTGEHRHAAELYQECLGLAEAAHNGDAIGRVLTNLALLYSEQGDYTVALSYAERRLNDPQLPQSDKRSTARALNAVAFLYARKGKYAAARSAIERGLGLMRDPDGDPVLEAILLGQRGNLWSLQGNYAKALEDYRAFEATCRQHRIPERRTAALESIASTLILMGRYEEALGSAQEGLVLVRQVGSQGVAWRFLTAEGVAYHRLQRLPEAEAALREAISSVESWHGQIAGGEQQGLGFSSFALTPYQELMALKFDQKQLADVLSLAERAKARRLSEVMAQGHVQITRAMSDAEKQQEQTLAQSAARWNAAMMRQSAADPKTTAAFEKAAGDLESFRSSLYAAHPELRVRRGETPPLTLAETDALLPDAQTLLLEFAVTDDAVYLIALRPGTPGKPVISAHRLEVTPAALQIQVDGFRRQLATRDLGYRASAQRLYLELLAPVEDALKSPSVVCIVPDGPLWSLPFQALVSPGGRHLIEQHAVFYAPSLTALRAGTGLHHATNAPGLTLFAMGPPDGSLPGATEEARELGRLYGSGSSTVLTGASATELRWKKDAPRYRILHLATHGWLNGTNPMFSFLQLGADQASGEDGMLEAREILDLDLHAELAVLSACETARGEVRNGEGSIGLSWAMMMAGTPSVVVSQWKVDSASTTQLMLAFHRAIQRGLTGNAPLKGKAEALRGAALGLLRSEEFRHPFYWSGFQLLGDGY
jgi:CHAT domain-containing protein